MAKRNYTEEYGFPLKKREVPKKKQAMMLDRIEMRWNAMLEMEKEYPLEERYLWLQGYISALTTVGVIPVDVAKRINADIRATYYTAYYRLKPQRKPTFWADYNLPTTFSGKDKNLTEVGFNEETKIRSTD